MTLVVVDSEGCWIAASLELDVSSVVVVTESSFGVSFGASGVVSKAASK